MSKYVVPTFEGTVFNCPYCNVCAQQRWTLICYKESTAERFDKAQCILCSKNSIWLNGKIIYPIDTNTPPLNPDLPDNLKQIYIEAQKIVSLSPRSSFILIRSLVEELVKNILGSEVGDNFNDNIGILAQRDIPEKIKKLLDIVRLFGNSAAHLGKINLGDLGSNTEHPEIITLGDLDINVVDLFDMVNTIVDFFITSPNHIDSIYDKLSESSKDAIKRRDASK